MRSNVLIIYGLPAVGKTSLITELLKTDEFYYIAAETIWEETFSNPEYTMDESKIVFDKLIKIIKDTMQNHKQNIIIEGVFANKEKINIIRHISETYEYVCRAILLQASDIVVKQRLIHRNKNSFSVVQLEALKKSMTSTNVADIILNTENYTSKELVMKILSKKCGFCGQINYGLDNQCYCYSCKEKFHLWENYHSNSLYRFCKRCGEFDMLPIPVISNNEYTFSIIDCWK